MPQGTERSILQSIRPENARNQAISQIASEFTWVAADVRVDDLAEELSEAEHTAAVGVVSAERRVLGLVSRDNLFTVLGRPYGRDVLRNLSVAEVMSGARTFRHDTNLFSVAEELTDALRANEISYFLMDDEQGRFRGIFSTHDLMLHLSNMTQNDIELARRLQTRLVRERELVAGASFEFAAHSASAKGVGGDFYSIRQFGEDRWFISLCDVSGKGIAASIVTSVIWGMMSVYDFSQGMIPIIRKLNDYMVRTFEAEKFVTGLFMTYDEVRGEVVICDMGHSHIFVLRGGRLMRITTGQSNLPLGVVLEIEPTFSRFRPQTGDILMALTDGLLEQQNERAEEYSIERVARVLKRHADDPVELINDALVGDFESFRGTHHLNDDVTYGMMRFVPQDVRL